MSQGKHIGKVVISTQDCHTKVRAPIEEGIQFDSDASYLICGGFGGLGLALAQWIVERGGRHIVLFGRSGATQPESQDKIAGMLATGVNIFEAKVDASSFEEVNTLLQEVRKVMPPLKGVLSCRHGFG